MYIRQMRQFFRNADDTFDERKLGFPGIVDFLRACQREGLLRLDRDRQGVLRVFPGANFAKPAIAIGRRRARDCRGQRGADAGRHGGCRRRHRGVRNALHSRDRRRHHADHRRHAPSRPRRRSDGRGSQRRPRATSRSPTRSRASARERLRRRARRRTTPQEGGGHKNGEDATRTEEREGQERVVNCGLRLADCGWWPFALLLSACRARRTAARSGRVRALPREPRTCRADGSGARGRARSA